MKCRKVEKYLSQFIDNNLSIEKTYEIKQHLDFCEKCNETFEKLKKVKKSVADVHNHTKINLDESFNAQLKSKIKDKNIKLGLLPYQIRNAVLISATILLLFLGSFILVQSGILFPQESIPSQNEVVIYPPKINDDSKQILSKYSENKAMDVQLFEEFIATIYYIEAIKPSDDYGRKKYLLNYITEYYSNADIAEEAKEELDKIE